MKFSTLIGTLLVRDMQLIDNMINSTFVMMIIENNFINHFEHVVRAYGYTYTHTHTQTLTDFVLVRFCFVCILSLLQAEKQQTKLYQHIFFRHVRRVLV